MTPTNFRKGASMTDEEIRLWALELVVGSTKTGPNTISAIERIAGMVLAAADKAFAMRAIEATAKMASGCPADMLLPAIDATARFLKTGYHHPQPGPVSARAEAAPQTIPG
jgi:hypothetical protein